jgi:hypothetical protein
VGGFYVFDLCAAQIRLELKQYDVIDRHGGLGLNGYMTGKMFGLLLMLESERTRLDFMNMAGVRS